MIAMKKKKCEWRSVQTALVSGCALGLGDGDKCDERPEHDNAHCCCVNERDHGHRGLVHGDALQVNHCFAFSPSVSQEFFKRNANEPDFVCHVNERLFVSNVLAMVFCEVETFGDAYSLFVEDDPETSGSAVDFARTHDIPDGASLLLYVHLHGNDSELEAFIMLVPDAASRLREEAAEGFADADPLLDHIGTLFGHHASQGLCAAIANGRCGRDDVESFASDCFSLFSDVSVSQLSNIIQVLGRRVLPLMSFPEQALFALLVCCFCVFDEMPNATPDVIEERFNAFAVTLENGESCPRFFSLVENAFEIAMDTSFPKWFAHCPEACQTLRHFLDGIMRFPRLAALLPP